MANKTLKTLDVRTRRQWREWLAVHHRSDSEVWLVFHKRHLGVACLSYDAAVEEALCFGWIDSLVRRLDDERYARKFTPRKPESRWSTANRRRYERLKASGRLAPAGRERAPTDRSGDAPRPDLSALPDYIEQGLKANACAWQNFLRLSPSCRRAYLVWIDSAKRDATKAKRLAESIIRLASGQKLGLK